MSNIPPLGDAPAPRAGGAKLAREVRCLSALDRAAEERGEERSEEERRDEEVIRSERWAVEERVIEGSIGMRCCCLLLLPIQKYHTD